jgi:nitrile hydratase
METPEGAEPEGTRLTYHRLLGKALIDVLLEKGVFSAEDLRREVERIDSPTPRNGARLIARAWIDGAFKARLLAEPQAAAAELGIDVGPRPIRVVANTESVHNLIVCTLCSCYPRFLLGQPPAWYKSRNYRSRAVREPRAVLAEFGTRLPEGQSVRVHDSTAELRYMVLPLRPAGTERLDETALGALIDRDCLIGVRVPLGPTGGSESDGGGSVFTDASR